MVLYADNFKMSRSLRRRIRQKNFEIRVDSAVAEVIESCANAERDGQAGTWITGAMIDAYKHLHALGYCHSVEAWHDGILVGGLYGVAMGGVFFGESMFARRADASKVSLAALVKILQHQRVTLIDCQQETKHLASLGAKAISRRAFAAELERLIHSNEPPSGWPRGPIEV